jgi:hypothetical protein
MKDIGRSQMLPNHVCVPFAKCFSQQKEKKGKNYIKAHRTQNPSFYANHKTHNITLG